MFEDFNKKKEKPVFFILSIILHILIFSLLLFIPDTRKYTEEKITEVIIPEPLKKPIHYPEEKKIIRKKKKKIIKPKPIETKKKTEETRKARPPEKPKNNFSLVKERKQTQRLKQKPKPILKQKPPKPIKKSQTPIPKKKMKKLPLTKRRMIIVPDKEPKGPVKGRDNLPPGSPGKGGKYLYKGISKIKPKNKKKGLIIPYGGKNRFSFKLGDGIGGGSGWKNYGASVAFDTHGINLDPWIKEVIRRVKANWIVPTAAKLGLKGYNAFYLVFSGDGSLSEFKVLVKSKVISFNLSSQNAIQGSVPFPPLPDYYPYKTVKARFLFYYNLYPGETSEN
jgi:hypothetical protein